MNNLTEENHLRNKWQPILEHADLAPITSTHRRDITATLLENTEIALRESGSFQGHTLLGEANANVTGANIDNFDPVLISLVRRSMPNLMAYDICGVQAMTGPSGLIFAMRARYGAQNGTEAFYNEANTGFSTIGSGNTTVNLAGGRHIGNTLAVANNAGSNAYNYATGLATSVGELYGNSTVEIPEMSFSVEKVTATAVTRALKAEYTMELAQDLKSIHGLDAETELANILSAELIADINREVVRAINVSAVQGASSDTTTAGIFDLDTDSNGRWSVEKFKGLMFQIEREANRIARDTRRGKGNIVICSSDVASALQMAGVLDYAPALNSNNLNVDDTGNTFAGVLNGRMKVYIDPYAGANYMTVGYKGAGKFDAGLFYCPYVPLQMVRAVDQNNFQPKIGFKTRYAMVANPFAEGTDAGNGVITQDTNRYYRRVRVNNLL
jgi:hypothetical protein